MPSRGEGIGGSRRARRPRVAMIRIGCGSARRGICIGSGRERAETVIPKRNSNSRRDARCRPKGLEWWCCSTEPRLEFPPESECRRKSAGRLSFEQSTKKRAHAAYFEIRRKRRDLVVPLHILIANCRSLNNQTQLSQIASRNTTFVESDCFPRIASSF